MSIPTEKARTWQRRPKGAVGVLLPAGAAHPSKYGRFNVATLLLGRKAWPTGSLSSQLGLNPLMGDPSGEQVVTALQRALRAVIPEPTRSAPYPYTVGMPMVVRLTMDVTWPCLFACPAWPAAIAAVRAGLAPRAYLFDPPPLAEIKRRLSNREPLWQDGADDAAQKSGQHGAGAGPDSEAG